MSSTRTTQKVQRWIDLLTALLRHSFAQTFLELARGVPEYLADGSVDEGEPSPTLKRMFERDKLELRAMGVPIETVGEEGDEESHYRLRAAGFYLPYLEVTSQRGTLKPRRVDRDGYRAITSLTFDSDELVAIAEGAARARQLGDQVLRADIDSAVRKLAVDLPLGAASAGDATYIRKPRTRADEATFASLGDALFRQKRVGFEYHTMGRDATSERSVEPYGLFFLNSHWYLVGRDVEKHALRNFRVSRIAKVKVNPSKEGTPDFAIPVGFSLSEHAKSRSAWELGDENAFEAIVELRGESGATLAAAATGAPVIDHPDRRCWDVRRADVFARWLLSFAEELIPLSPPPLVQEFARQVAATRALYAAEQSA